MELHYLLFKLRAGGRQAHSDGVITYRDKDEASSSNQQTSGKLQVPGSNWAALPPSGPRLGQKRDRSRSTSGRRLRFGARCFPGAAAHQNQAISRRLGALRTDALETRSSELSSG